MNLLIITQKVDKKDPVLGFFHRWIEEFSKRCEKLTVICLEKGEYNLPDNVKVLSLGKEENKSKAEYLSRLYRYIWHERVNYDTVFVHMNQEYVVLCGLFWKVLGKKVFLWRNHVMGSILTHLAIYLSDRVFCTSSESFTARFKKTEIMPVGIDVNFFKPDPSTKRIPNSILFLGRIAPVKRVLEFVEWFNTLDEKFVATVGGSSLPKDSNYEKLTKSKASSRIKFIGPVTQEEALRLYQSHELYVNLTPSGSMDKTILEAAACETRVKVENNDLKMLESKEGKELRDFVVENHSLEKLVSKILIK